MNLYITTAAVAAAVCAGQADAAFIVDFDASVSFAGTHLDGIIGDGISNANFVRATNAGEGIEIGLKAIERFIGNLPNTDERYFAQPGVTTPALPSPPGSTWNYVLVADLGAFTIADLQIDLAVDFDPAFGVTAFTNIDVTAGAILQGAGGLSQFGGSENLDFDFWQTLLGAPAFDPNIAGEYEIAFTIRDPANNEILAETVNIVEVVPTPGATALLAFGGIAAGRRRR